MGVSGVKPSRETEVNWLRPTNTRALSLDLAVTMIMVTMMMIMVTMVMRMIVTTLMLPMTVTVMF